MEKLTQNRKADRTCNLCNLTIATLSLYKRSGRSSICESCFFAPPEIQNGVLNEDIDGNQQCHICYSYYACLGIHIKRHGLTAKEYKEEFGLNRQTPLMSKARRERQSEVARSNQAKGHFPDGEFGRKLLDSFRAKGSKSVLSPRLQVRRNQAENFQTNNPMKNPEVREKHLLAIRKRKKA